jgi:peptide/nickel transport system permease protein
MPDAVVARDVDPSPLPGSFRFFCSIVQSIAGTLLLLFLAGFLATALVRLAPGFGIDEHALDLRFGGSPAAQRGSDDTVIRAYASLLGRALSGDLGESTLFRRPVGSLLRERIRVTMQSVATGVAAGWITALVLCVFVNIQSPRPLRWSVTSAIAVLLALPSSVIAFGAVIAGASATAAIGAVVIPKVFRFADNLTADTQRQPYILSARARGLSELRVVVLCGARQNAPQLVTLLGVTLTAAFGSAIPIEVFCDQPGLGQLAWRAALGRDLPVVVAVTLVIASIALFSNTAARLTADAISARRG